MTVLTVKTDNLEYVQDTVSKLANGWRREVTFRWRQQYVFRVTATRDTYAGQSGARVEVFSPRDLQWNTLRTMTAADAGLDNVKAVGSIEKARESTENAVEKLLAYAQALMPR